MGGGGARVGGAGAGPEGDRGREGFEDKGAKNGASVQTEHHGLGKALVIVVYRLREHAVHGASGPEDHRCDDLH